MTQEEAKQVIESALDKAVQKGVYSLQDMAFIMQALNVIYAPQEIETDKK